ncbi:glycosyltransferase [Cognatilysobacter lacus]|uniref:Glycosyltransferase n=1 Tax=Cognatilysobacter lacus TaxID=1643323 RepID=A0A5D8YS71_9GAMM|nr:glycosyltransferase [Lysobacter lacus]TZF85230.1 glycosyltransferase [Lysobacter lacus]
MTLDLFYAEPDPDRWLPFDRYPRRLVRRALRGKPRPGGQTRVFLNLMAGLDEIGVSYRVNDYRHARRHPDRLACIVGKPFVLDRVEWRNPILFGASVFSHPIDDPDLFARRPVRKVLVPGPWMEAMCKPYWGDRVQAWPVGIDTALWHPADPAEKSDPVLLYDKVLWDRPRREASLVQPIRDALADAGQPVVELRYGNYVEDDYLDALRRCRAMIFLCDHETQGIAYQQALSCDVPILAWDLGGPWRDPSYYPDRVMYGPVSSVPYWDDRCGLRFTDAGQFRQAWRGFIEQVRAGHFEPRQYILENLTLAGCASRYLEIARQVQADAASDGAP